MQYRDVAAYTVDLPNELRDALEREREPGEQMLWAGQPEPGRTVRAEWAMFAFAIPWTAFSLFWESMAIGMTFAMPRKATAFGWVFVLFGLPFVGIGFGMLSAPFVAMANARRTVYALTNRRLLAVTRTGKGQKTRSFVPRHRNDLSRTECANGSGDLVFAPAPRRNQIGMDAPLNAFYGIKNVHEVERLLRETFFPASEQEKPARQSFGVGVYHDGR